MVLIVKGFGENLVDLIDLLDGSQELAIQTRGKLLIESPLLLCALKFLDVINLCEEYNGVITIVLNELVALYHNIFVGLQNIVPMETVIVG